MIIYGLSNCDSCKKALRALPDFKLHDVRAQPLSRAELKEFYARFGADLVNRRSTTWRNLSDAERQSDPLDLLAAHPSVMKRPLLRHGGGLLLGWGEETQKVLL